MQIFHHRGLPSIYPPLTLTSLVLCILSVGPSPSLEIARVITHGWSACFRKKGITKVTMHKDILDPHQEVASDMYGSMWSVLCVLPALHSQCFSAFGYWLDMGWPGLRAEWLPS